MKKSISQSLFWKILERFGVSGIQFVLQLIMARHLAPEHYGVLAIMVIFTSLANVFIQNGFSAALIQNKDVTEEDYSSVFWITILIALLLYGVIFLMAPWIGLFYENSILITPLRVLALLIFPGAMYSIQVAKVSREMDFQKVFLSSIGGLIISGMAGVLIAYADGGLWALVAQNVLNVTVSCIMMIITTKWIPRFVCNWKRVVILFRFGWKLLVSSLLDVLDEHLQNLIVGKKYNSGTLGFYNRGMQFPVFLTESIVSAVHSVLLPAMSLEQDDKKQVKALAKTSLTLSSYVLLPMMAGLACIARPLVCLLLTEKWLPCVPYVQIFCCIFAFYEVHVCNLQAINALGRSDLFLKLEMIKKSYEIVFIAIAVLCFDSPLAIAMIGAITNWISWIINAGPNKKLIDYSFWEQLTDLLPTMLLSAGMMACVVLAGSLCAAASLSDMMTIVLQIIVGVAAYLILSVAVKPAAYRMLLDWAGGYLKKR